jgi:hypothetical protein
MSFLESLSNIVDTAKNRLRSMVSPVTDAVQTALPQIATDRGSQQLLGTPSEGSNTMTGGKRRRTHRRRRRHTRRRR